MGSRGGGDDGMRGFFSNLPVSEVLAVAATYINLPLTPSPLPSPPLHLHPSLPFISPSSFSLILIPR